MNADDRLLERWVAKRDPEAFAGLASRHAGLVYGTCRRVLGTHHEAEDAAQECLFEFSRKAAEVRGEVAAYLHTLALSRARDRLRSETARRRREQAMAAMHPGDAPGLDWQERRPQLDEALAALPEEQRLPILLHFLEGRKQADIAEELGCDQGTVSRRLAAGLQALREHLGGRDDDAAASALAGLLAGRAGGLAPPGLLAAAGKMALAQPTAGSPFGAWAVALGLLAAAIMAAVLLWSSRSPSAPRAAGPPPPAEQRPTAHPIMEADMPAATPIRRPNLDGLHLSGFGMVRDSVAVALEAAAKRLGREADYEMLYLRSGSAFAPGIDTGESCRSWWHVRARAGTANLPALAASLGLVAEPLAVPPRPAADNPALAAWFAAVAARISTAMDSGAVVLSEGGWSEPGGWHWAGIVTEAGADGTIRGAALSAVTGNGKEGVPWRFPAALWTIRPGAAPTPAAELDRATLRIAIDRIRGSGTFAPRDGLIFGLAAMDAWISTMRSERGFCAECFSRTPIRGVHDASDNDKRLLFAARMLERRLGSAFPSLPAAARAQLEQAAAGYARIAKQLSESVERKHFYEGLDSLEAQAAYADGKLAQVRHELSAIAERLAEALRLAGS